MSKTIFKRISIIIVAIILLAFTSCKSQEDSLLLKQQELYGVALESGFSGTFEEWMDLITGVSLNSIEAIEINEQGELIITYTNNEVVNLGVVKGEAGLGIYDVRVDEDGSLIVTYTDGSIKNLGKVESSNNSGITDISVNSEGLLVVTYANGTKKTLGQFSGNQGFNSIVDIYINTSGHLVVTLSDGTTKDLGKIGLGSDDTSGVVPVYQGMSVTSNESVSLYGLTKSNTFKESIDDYLDIITTERVEYYAKKGETFNICIHLYNPSAYEILSFTLNGYKYQTYEFKEGSTSTKLIVEAKAPNISGINEYTIDGIKYVDGTQIKDVQMDGEKTVKVGVQYDILPTSTIIKEEVDATSYMAHIETFDMSNILEEDGLHFFVYDGKNIVGHYDLNLGINEVFINDLLMGVRYEYMVVGVYDDLSGKGKHAGVLNEGAFTTLGGYELTSVKTTKDSIKVSLDVFDDGATFEKIELKHKDEVVMTKDYQEEIIFDNLLSNNEYEIVITYSYIKDGVKRTGRINKLVVTKPKNTPSFTLNKQDVSYSDIDFSVEESDVDQVKINFKASLFEGDVKIAEINDTEGTFDSLNSNTLYTIVYEYTYDLNDGFGMLQIVSKALVETKQKEIPSIDIAYSKDTSSLSYTSSISDKLNVLTDVTYKLYQGIVLIDQTKEHSFTFNNLSSNTLYTLEVHYSYDLKDGKEEVTKVNKYDITLSKEVPTIEITPYLITNNKVEYNVLIKDSNAVGRVNMVALYVDNTFLKRLDESTTVINNLSSNTTYNIRLNYVYDLDDGLGSREINYRYDFTTLKEEPSLNLLVSSVTYNSVNISYDIIDHDDTLTFNKLELLLNGSVISSLTSINSTTFNNLLSDSEYTLKATFTKNLNNGESVVVKTMKFKTNKLPSPVVNLNLSSTTSTITYSYTLLDNHNISKVSSVKLYYQGDVVDITDNNYVFSNLYSDSTYKLVVTLEVDYQDGKGIVYEAYEQEIITKAFSEPTVDVNLSSSVDSISLLFDNDDPHKLINITSVNLYQGSSLVSSITNMKELEFTNLVSNSLYDISIEYQIDYRNNQHLVTKTLYRQYSTLAHKVKVVGFEILNENQPMTNETISVSIKLENISNVKVDYAIINNERYNVVGGDYKNYVIVNLKTPRLGGVFNINLSKIGYHINNLDIEQSVENIVDIEINVMSKMDIVSVSTPNASSIYNTSYSTGCIFTIDNPNGYVVTKLYDYNFDVVMIDDYHFYIDMPMCDSFFISGFEYIDANGNVAKRLYNDYIEFDGFGLLGDSETNATVAQLISTPEELLNIRGNHYYELACDIDMSGYIWEPTDFNGIFNGKGHKISNLTMIESNEYYYTEFGMFTSSNFIFENVYFENIYFSYESNNISTYILIGSWPEFDYPVINNVLFSGSINLNTEGEAHLNFPIGNNIFVVDELLFNSTPYKEVEVISSSKLEDEDFVKNTLGWDFLEKVYDNHNGLMYSTIDDAYVIINGYNGPNTTLEIPKTINGLPVIGIEDLAFENNTIITKVVYPESLLFIGASTLKGCYNIEEIVIENADAFGDDRIFRSLFGGKMYDNSYFVTNAYIPNGFKHFTIKGENSVGNIFDGLTTLETLVYGCGGMLDSLRGTNIKRLELLEGVTSINGSSCYQCTNLVEVILPNSLKSIGDQAFNECSNLKNINLPDSLTYLGAYAFMYCYNLEEITIPSSLTKIQDQTFFYCVNLKEVVIPETIVELGNSTFEGCEALETFTFPSKLTSIPQGTLLNCQNIKIVSIPENVTYIGNQAFYNLNKLYKIDLPDSITHIGMFAFSNCLSLRSIDLPASLVEIGEGAFDTCRYVKTITFGNKLEIIGNNAFSNCSNLVEVILPNSVKKMGVSVFSCCYSLETVKLPTGITKIDENIFLDCYMLSSIVIPEGVTTIEKLAFRGCSGLLSVTLPSTLKEICHEAFAHCAGIQTLIIPKSVEYIGIKVFENCFMKIYCESDSQPLTWDVDWNIGGLEVVWGYKEEE